MNVATQLSALLVGAGIDTVFVVPGGACSALAQALTEEPRVRLVASQNETTAGYAAAGWHRATGRPGIVLVTSGPGALATCAPLAAARLDEDGVVVIAGDVSTRDRARGVLQDGGVHGLSLATVMSPLAGLAVRVEHAHQAAARLQTALQRASGPRALPTFLEIPIDVQQARATPSSLAFASAAPRAEALPLDAVLELLDAEASALLPEDHPWRVGTYGVGDDGRADAWLRAHPPDPLLVIGARLDDTTTAGFAAELLGRPILQLDDVPEHFARACPIAAGVCGSLPQLLQQLVDALPERERDVERARPPRRAASWPALARPPFEPRAAAAALARAFSAETVFVSDIGNHLLASLQVRPVQFSLGLGGMGSGLGLGLGYALAGRGPVVTVCGDGGIAMFGNELLTAVACEAPLVLAIFQDGQLGMVRHGHERIFGSSHPYSLAGFDLMGWARSLGARAEYIESEAQLQALAAQPLDGPRVLVFPIDPNARVPNPRDASFNFGVAHEL